MDEDLTMDGAPEEGDTNMMDTVMDRLTAEQREKALRIAHKYGIHEGDVTWVLVLLAQDAQDSKEWAGRAAQAAGEAADRIRDEIRGLPDKLKEGAASGAEAIRNNIWSGGQDLEKAIKEAVVVGGRGLLAGFQKAESQFVQKLEAAVEEKKKEVIQDWQAELATAARKNESIRAWKWLAIGAAAMIIGISGSYLAGAQNGPVFGPMAESWHGFINCEEPGWKIKELEDGSYCFPHPAADGLHGWRIP